MAITLSDETEKLVQERMSKGGFASPDELVRAALRVLDEQEPFDPELDEILREGLAEAERGEGVPLEDAVRDLRARYFGRRQD